MKTTLRYMFIFIVSVLFFFNCAANKTNMKSETTQTPGEDIDNMFGISEDDQSSNQKNDEAEVLRLLGITNEEKEQEQSQVEQTTPSTSEPDENLNKEISELETLLSKKDSEISNLKSEIAMKDQKITELESDKTITQPRIEYSGTADSYRESYQDALQDYNNKNYQASIQKFESLLERDSKNSLSDNSQYWIGESYYGLGNFNQAIVEFTKVFSFNKSNKLDAAQLKLGLCYWKLGNKARAREELDRLISNFPQSEYIEKAKYFISKF